MTSTNQSRSLGIALVLAASFGYALQLPLRHLAELQGTSSLQLVFLATLAASVIILPTLPWCLKNRPPWIGVLVLACGRGMAISGYFQALQTLPPSLAVMFFFSGPLLVLLQTTVFRLEKLTLMQFTSFFIGISGLALALDSSLNVEELTGVLWALFGGLGLSWEYIAVRVWIPLNKAISGTLLSIIASSALVMPMAWYFDSAPPSTNIDTLVSSYSAQCVCADTTNSPPAQGHSTRWCQYRLTTHISRTSLYYSHCAILWLGLSHIPYLGWYVVIALRLRLSCLSKGR